MRPPQRLLASNRIGFAPALQAIGGGQSGNAAADDRDRLLLVALAYAPQSKTGARTPAPAAAAESPSIRRLSARKIAAKPYPLSREARTIARFTAANNGVRDMRASRARHAYCEIVSRRFSAQERAPFAPVMKPKRFAGRRGLREFNKASAACLAPARKEEHTLLGLRVRVEIVMADLLEDGIAAARRGEYATAVPIFRSLAEQGNASAQSTLGDMYLLGQGVPKDYAEAFRWLRLAVNQGRDSTDLWRDVRSGSRHSARFRRSIQIALPAAKKAIPTHSLIWVVFTTRV